MNEAKNKGLLNCLRSIDWFLLVFISLFTMDKVVLKPVVLIAGLIYIGRYLSIRQIRQSPLFYLLIPVLEIIKLLFLNHDFSSGHIVSFLVGECYWLMCLLAFVVMATEVKRMSTLNISRTLIAFFFINFFWSLGNLVHVMVLAHTINPYSSVLLAYGNSTGDYIKGIFMGPCYINAFVNSFFAIYFLYSKRYFLTFLAVLTACLTTSNFVNIIFIPVLLVLAFVMKDKKAKWIILGQLVLFAVFYIFASYDNLVYLFSSLRAKEDFTQMPLSSGEKKLLKPNGKAVSVEQTYNYLLSSPGHFLFGSGIGDFSSQLAVRTSDLNIKNSSRLFKLLPRHMSPDFLQNHYRIYSLVYSLPPAYHSIRHLPSSFLNQIFGEYGVVGFLIFILFYVFYVFRRHKQISYSLVMMILLGCYLMFDYLFEYLSVVVIFELFFLLDLKQHQEKNTR
jgi:hypothetical protein